MLQSYKFFMLNASFYDVFFDLSLYLKLLVGRCCIEVKKKRDIAYMPCLSIFFILLNLSN